MISGRSRLRGARFPASTTKLRHVAAAWLAFALVCSTATSCSDTAAQAAPARVIVVPATSDTNAPTTTSRSTTTTTPHSVTGPIGAHSPVTTLSRVPTLDPVTTSSALPVSSDPPSRSEARVALPAKPVPRFDVLRAATLDLATDNIAMSVSVWRGTERLAGWATGTRVDGTSADTDTTFVLASVSKLITALTVARLIEAGTVESTQTVPWDAMGIAHDPGWTDVTVRELLAHGSGMPVNQKSWLDEAGSCRIPLSAAMATPPTETRGTWRYSNGNYCALGLLIEHVTGTPLDEAARDLVLAPVAATGAYLSTEGIRPTSAPYAKGILGVERLDRLGGAGTWIASSDDIAAALGSVTAADRETLQWPAVIVDQYGWGHTGSVDGAAACAWVFDEGATVLVALVSGPRPATGGALCDRLVPALASDLGVWTGDPLRNPV